MISALHCQSCVLVCNQARYAKRIHHGWDVADQSSDSAPMLCVLLVLHMGSSGGKRDEVAPTASHASAEV